MALCSGMDDKQSHTTMDDKSEKDKRTSNNEEFHDTRMNKNKMMSWNGPHCYRCCSGIHLFLVLILTLQSTSVDASFFTPRQLVDSIDAIGYTSTAATETVPKSISILSRISKNAIATIATRNINLQLSSSPNPNDNGRKTLRNMLPSRRDLFKLAGGIILLTPLAAEGYAITGKLQTNTDSIPLPQVVDNTNGGVYTVVFHGANGPDPNTDALMSALITADGGSGDRTKMVDWTADSVDVLRASARGVELGRRLADRFWADLASVVVAGGGGGGGGGGVVAKVHVIGISVGAFAADSFAQSLKRKEVGSGLENCVQLTLLDPFALKGALGVGYGDREFGKGVDYAQQYLNTDDPVPSTNHPLPKCATIDVTSLRPPEIFGHDWPLVYYTRLLNSGGRSSSRTIIPTEERREKGSVEVL